MTKSKPEQHDFKKTMDLLRQQPFSMFDALPENSLEEKLISLLQNRRALPYSKKINEQLVQIRKSIDSLELKKTRLVVLGGGSGLSNIVGGDSRRSDWMNSPFTGLKQLFPHLNSIVCITDDGGSTGEMQKDLPLVALGDLRHVLLSSIQLGTLRKRYKLTPDEAALCVVALYAIFNYRFHIQPESPKQILADTKAALRDLPLELCQELIELTTLLFQNPRLRSTLRWPQCLGNLLLAASIYREAGNDGQASDQKIQSATIAGLNTMAAAIGAPPGAVLPCSSIPARLQMLYANGVLVTSEAKSSQAKRGYPVDRVLVEFSRPAELTLEVEQVIRKADIILLAPGSLYTSIIPVLQVPGLAEAIRMNKQALKVLVANLWVQKGETDAAHDAPDRKFQVSDLLCAYHRNIPGGIKDLCSHVIALDMSNIPASILQRYGLEGKQPILFDRQKMLKMGFIPVEASIFSETMMREHRILQHDPSALATAIQGLWALHDSDLLKKPELTEEEMPEANFVPPVRLHVRSLPCQRYEKIIQRVRSLQFQTFETGSTDPQEMPQEQSAKLIEQIAEIIRSHPDIPLAHLNFIHGITLVDQSLWERSQQWDQVFSFYDPQRQIIKIRHEQEENINNFEMIFLIALGQSLLGNYALDKKMGNICQNKEVVGRIFRLKIRPPEELRSFLTFEDINSYLHFIRMYRNNDGCTYTRMINPNEGFTPPGLFFGLFYAWYLNNSFAPNIEYKMSIMRNDSSGLVPEQVKVLTRRRETIRFFRSRIFRQELPDFPIKKANNIS